MDKLKDSAKNHFRAGVPLPHSSLFRLGQEKTQSSQNQATNRNANVITVNNFVQTSGEVSENHDIQEKATPHPPKTERGLPSAAPAAADRDSIFPIFVTEPPAAPTSQEKNDKEAAPVELEELDQNPRLKIIKAKRFYEDQQVVIDVQFLIHVIKTLITHYHITISKTDIEGILAYFGDVEVGTKKSVIRTRDVEPATCCGMKEVNVEKIITTIKKIVINGCNIAKYFPELVEFLTEIGVSA
jgi:hypothetical protein